MPASERVAIFPKTDIMSAKRVPKERVSENVVRE
jgi:hypothetical protein